MPLNLRGSTSEESSLGFISERGDDSAMDMDIESRAALGPRWTRTQVG